MSRIALFVTAGILAVGLCTVSAAKVSVDAVAAATMNNKCKITSTTPSETGVTITWTETRSGGTMTCTVTPVGGAALPPHVVTASESSAKTLTFNGLAPSSAYSLQIIRTSGSETPYGASTSFTTLAPTGVVSASPLTATSFSALFNNGAIRLSLPVQSLDGFVVSLFNAGGACVQTVSLSGSGSVSLPVDGLASGIYMLHVANGMQTFSRSISIER